MNIHNIILCPLRMMFTLLTQEDINQIPKCVYRKLEVEFQNLKLMSEAVRDANLKNENIINNLKRQLMIYESRIYELILRKSFYEIEIEGIRYVLKSLLHAIGVLHNCDDRQQKTDFSFDTEIKPGQDAKRNKRSYDVCIQHTHDSSNTQTSNTSTDMTVPISVANKESTMSATNMAQIISKLINKIKKKTSKNKSVVKAYNLLHNKYKRLYEEYVSKTEEIASLCEENSNLSMHAHQYKSLQDIKDKHDKIQREYFLLLDNYNKLQMEFATVQNTNKDLQHKYRWYILTNRDDIGPLLGNEIDKIKDILYECLKVFADLERDMPLNLYKQYIANMKAQMDGYINLLVALVQPTKTLQSDFADVCHNISTVIALVQEIKCHYQAIIEKQRNIMKYKDETIKVLYSTRTHEISDAEINTLLLEIHKYKKDNKFLQKQLETISQNSLCDRCIDKDKELAEAKVKISVLNEKVTKLGIVCQKLRTIKDKYINIKNTHEKEI